MKRVWAIISVRLVLALLFGAGVAQASEPVKGGTLRVADGPYASNGAIRYVAPTGSDSNPGTEAQPWRTIQKAANTLVAGDTVYIKAGTYRERVTPQHSGSAGQYIVYSAYPGDTVTIDGASLDVPEWAGLFDVAGKHYIRVSGLRVMNVRSNPHSSGILADGSSHIVIENNYVYNTNDSGISVWNSHDVIVDRNEVEDACNSGWNESISVGVTSVFEVRYNHVHNTHKEGICTKDGSSNGKVFGNHVHHTDERVGIYVDAQDKHTYNIDVFQNVVHDIPADGIALASEQGGLLENVKVYNNVAYNNKWVGVHVTECCIASHPIQNVEIVNNTFYDNGWDPWGGGIALDNPQAMSVVIRNNICSQNLYFQIVVAANVSAANVTLDHNLIDGYRGTEGETRGDDYVEGNPMFVSAAGADFHLQQGSPAIDKGSAVNAPAVDFDGQPRPYGAGYDIGADEYMPETRSDGAMRLTTPPSGASDQNPAFSPDGARLVFTRFTTGYNSGPAGLFLLDLGSSHTITRLTPVEDQDNVNLPGSAWNAIRNRIVFASDRLGTDDVWRIAPNGTDFSRITVHSGPPYYIEPSWSPNGQWIVFEADTNAPEDEQQGSIWKVRADGTGLVHLTDGPGGDTDDRQPNWSPTGDRILFQRRDPGSDDWNLYTMDPDGSDLRQVTTSPAGDTDASWSPDGTCIVYSTDHGGLPVPNLFVIPASGGEPVRATFSATHEDGAPSWSPDGEWIAFESHEGQDETTPAALWRVAAPTGLCHTSDYYLPLIRKDIALTLPDPGVFSRAAQLQSPTL